MNESPPTRRTPSLALAALAVVACLGFAAFTGHIWEDYFITFRASLNLALGNGLVFQPGERVHSFTSPLGTLLPALFAIGGGDDVAVRALWCFRVVSALALGGAIWLAARTFERQHLARTALITAGVAWAIDPKIVDFSINGMESALLIFFLTLTWHGFANGGRVLPLAIGCSGLQWTRPDGCVFFAVLALGWIVFGKADLVSTWRTRLLVTARAIGWGILGYLPWLIIAWSYYGSPVPHTIMAKVPHHAPGELAGALALYPWRLLFGHVALHDIFLPTYHFFGGWPAVLAWPARLLAVGAALAWVWPRVLPAGRIASVALFVGGFYVEYIPRAPWYYPGWQAIAWLSWAYLLHALWQLRPDQVRGTHPAHAAVRITAAVIVCLQLALFVCVAWQMRVQQALIENGNRRVIGQWLATQAATPRDTVFLECLGYIGYFSGLKMLDYPGLSSPEVVAARKAGHERFDQIIAVLRPDWLVLRAREAAAIFGAQPELRNAYVFARAFDTRAAVDAHGFLPGRGYLNFDAVFLVYRRGDEPPASR